MKTEKKTFKAKHTAGTTADPKIEAMIREKASDRRLPCVTAEAIAATSGKSMLEIGTALDVLEVTISQCQLGLFGYYPQKRIVTAASRVDSALETAIKKRIVSNKLSCSDAWTLAQTLDLTKLAVASACEAMGVKIKPCQLGAF